MVCFLMLFSIYRINFAQRTDLLFNILHPKESFKCIWGGFKPVFSQESMQLDDKIFCPVKMFENLYIYIYITLEKSMANTW